MILYLDLDGVFVNFLAGVQKHTGAPYTKDSWTKIQTIPGFFQRLQPLQGAFRLFDTIKKHSTLRLEVLSSTPDPTGYLKSAHHDKECWVKRYLADIPVNTVQGWEHKALYAQNNLLIDDSFRNIQDWVASGGTGIHHTSNFNTLLELKYLGVLK